MSDVLKVESRAAHRSREVGQLRKQGLVPAVLYGHGEANLNLQLSMVDVRNALRAGHHIVDLGGAVKEKAIIKAIQWDAFGDTVLHIDFARVSATELVSIELPLELRGEAPGAASGGVVEQSVYKLLIKGPADALPDRVELKIFDLQFGKSITAAAVELPAKCQLTIPLDTILVSCNAPKAEKVAEAGAAPASVEPEVIRREKAAEDEEKKK